MPVRRLPTVIDGLLQPASSTSATPIMLDSPAWWEWLDDPANHSFSYQTSYGLVTLRREHKRGHWYWYAYHAAHGRLHKVYVGRSTKMSADCLHEIAHKLTDTPTHGVIRIALLGPPVIERDGQTLTLPAKALALLAYLGTQEGPQLRERLMALLWPMSSPEAARKNLRNMLWQLRQSLHPELIQGDEWLTLTEQVALDVRAFTQAATELTTTQPRPDTVLRAARTIARLYRGQLLDGVVLADTPDFEIWLTTTREHVFELNLRALQQIITSERAAARWPKVIAAAQAAITHDPLREPMYRAIIEAHAHLGDRAAALRQYALLKETLEHELGVVPLPETELLREAVLRGDLQHAMRPESPGAHPISNTSRRALPVPPFIGRTSELASLDSAWVTAQTRQAQVVLLLGEAGIGKSQLWRMWSAQQNAESTLIETQCLAVTAHLPFAPLIGIVHSERVKQRLIALSQPKPPGWLADIARLTPDLGDLLPMLPRQTLTSSAEEQHRVFEALVRCIGPAPGHPIMLFIDDIHWADRATLDWLGYLMHRARDTPLLLVATCRSDEIAPPIDSLAAQWARAGHLHRLTLARLSHAETLALVRALEGDLAQADTLYERSAGNPFFVIELLRAEPGALPAALTDLIQQRLVRLSDVARQVLQAAAVLQAEITFDSLTETSGRDDNETLDALDALRNSELLVEEAERYRFSHPLIATVVERGLSGARRTILYRRASAAVERRYAGRIGEAAGRLAAYHREANNQHQAAHFAELAGNHALTVAAPAEAAYFYELALTIDPAPSQHYGLALARYQQGDLDAARDAFAAAADHFAASGNLRSAARACLERARSHLASSQNEAVVAWVQRGRSYLAYDPDPAAQALAAYLLGAELRAVGTDLDAAIAQLEEAARLATDQAARPLLAGILLELGNARAQQGDLAGAISEYRSLVAAAHDGGEVVSEAIGHNNIAYHALLAGDMTTAHTEVAAGLDIAEQQELAVALQWLFSTRGEIALAEEDWASAEQWLGRAMREAERFSNTAHVIAIRVKLMLAAHDQGIHPAPGYSLEQAHAEATTLSDSFLQTQIDLALAETYWLHDNHDAADILLHAAEERLQHRAYARLRAKATQLRERFSRRSSM